MTVSTRRVTLRWERLFSFDLLFDPTFLNWNCLKKKKKVRTFHKKIQFNLKLKFNSKKTSNEAKKVLTLAGFEHGSPRLPVRSADHSATRGFFSKIKILFIMFPCPPHGWRPCTYYVLINMYMLINSEFSCIPAVSTGRGSRKRRWRSVEWQRSAWKCTAWKRRARPDIRVWASWCCSWPWHPTAAAVARSVTSTSS